MAEMYVKGVSTRNVTDVVEELCGLEVTSTQVSCAAELDEQLEACRNRPIGEIVYLVLHARYAKVRHDAALRSCALLTAIGIDTDGKRSVLGCSVQLSEAEPHWRKFLESLQKRGMHGVKLIVSDDHAGLRAAREAVMAGVPWQRCQCERTPQPLLTIQLGLRVGICHPLILEAGHGSACERCEEAGVGREEAGSCGLHAR